MDLHSTGVLHSTLILSLFSYPDMTCSLHMIDVMFKLIDSITTRP